MYTHRRLALPTLALIALGTAALGCGASSTQSPEPPAPASSSMGEQDSDGTGAPPADHAVEDEQPTIIECGTGAGAPPPGPPGIIERAALTINVVPAHGDAERFATPPADMPPLVIRARVVSDAPNRITDVDRWLQQHPLPIDDTSRGDAPKTLAGADWIYRTTGSDPLHVYGAPHRISAVYAADSGSGHGLDLTPLARHSMLVTWVERVGDTVYASYSSRRSASAMEGDNGFIAAFDILSGELLWQSATMVANQDTFAIAGDVVYTGYGFTDEDDYIYALNRHSGEVVHRFRIPTRATHIIAQGDLMNPTLAVRTYNRDMIIDVEVEYIGAH